MTLKLYTVVRNDLSPGAQAAQSAHAVAALALKHPHQFKNWNNQTIVLLQTQYPDQLEKLVESAVDGDFAHATFTEPDEMWINGYPYLDGLLTAVAFVPNWLVQNVLLKDLPLAVPEIEMIRPVSMAEPSATQPEPRKGLFGR
jgi:hypothetical protein